MAVMNTMTKKANWGEKGLFGLTSRSQSFIEGSQGKTQAGLEPEAGAHAEAMEGAASWLAHHGLPIELTTTRPGIAPPIVAWALPHQSLAKKMPHRLAYILILWSHFLN